jgi:hypothetical protein
LIVAFTACNRLDATFTPLPPGARRGRKTDKMVLIGPSVPANSSLYQFRWDKSDEPGMKVVGRDRKMAIALINGHSR